MKELDLARTKNTFSIVRGEKDGYTKSRLVDKWKNESTVITMKHEAK